MSKTWVLLAVVLFFWMACFSSEKKPVYKLNDDQLAHLMLDIQFSEATLPELTKARQDTLKDLFWLRFTDTYKLSEADIKEEIRQLEEDPDKMKIILDKVKMLADSIR